MILDTYNDFNFMVLLLFVYIGLIGFIGILIINAKHRATAQILYNYKNPHKMPQTTSRCDPNNPDNPNFKCPD